MSDEPTWIKRQALLLKHAEMLRLFGGAEGVRDDGALESALIRPVNAWSYGESRIARLAAAYAFGIAKNHPFVDGNKRAAFVAYTTFLKANGFNLSASQPKAYRTMLALAGGEMGEDEFANWIERNVNPRDAR